MFDAMMRALLRFGGDTADIGQTGLDTGRKSVRGILEGWIKAASRHNYIATLATELSILGLSLFALKLCAYILGPTGFGEYALAKRALSILTFTLACGLGIAVPRYVSLTEEASATSNRQGAYLLGALLLSASILTVFATLALSGLLPLGKIFLGDASPPFMASALVAAVIGLSMHTICNGYLRGKLWMRKANALQLINLGLTPIVALLACGAQSTRAIALMGLGWGIVSIIFGCTIAAHQPFKGVSASQLKDSVRILLSFGVIRVPGEFALFALTAIPTFVAAHKVGIQSAGVLSLSISILQVVGALFTGVGVLLLPQVSRLVSTGATDRARRLVRTALLLSLAIAGAVAGVLFLSADLVINIFFGTQMGQSTTEIRWLLVGVFPYVTYLTLRNPLDAVASWPYNSINLTAGCLLLVALLWLGGDYLSPGSSLTFALLLVGCASLMSWRHSCKSETTHPERLIGQAGD